MGIGRTILTTPPRAVILCSARGTGQDAANCADLASDEGGYRTFEWANQPEELARLPHPGDTIPTLIVGDCRGYHVWGGPVLFLFSFYDPELDDSGYLGKVFVVREG